MKIHQILEGPFDNTAVGKLKQTMQTAKSGVNRAKASIKKDVKDFKRGFDAGYRGTKDTPDTAEEISLLIDRLHPFERKKLADLLKRKNDLL